MREGFFRAVSTAEFTDLLRGFAPLGAETVDLDQAHGRFLAEDIVPAENLPAADRASMDGYAVRAAEVFGAGETNPAYLDLAMDIPIGTRPDNRCRPGAAPASSPGHCCPPGPMPWSWSNTPRIWAPEPSRSGGPWPRGTTCFWPVRTSRGGVLAAGRAPPGDRHAGRLGPCPGGGWAAAPGGGALHRRRTGAHHGQPGPGPDPRRQHPCPARHVARGRGRAHGLSLGARRSGRHPRRPGNGHGPIRSDAPVRRQFGRARDYTLDALRVGADILAHGVAISPGKPTILGRTGGKPVLGCPDRWPRPRS